MRTGRLSLAAATVLLLAGPAAAQGVPKLPNWIPDEAAQLMWCSAVFLEQANQGLLEDAPTLSQQHDALSYELQLQAEAMLGPDVTQDELDMPWVAVDNAAEELSAADRTAFLEELDACEDAHGHLTPWPQKTERSDLHPTGKQPR